MKKFNTKFILIFMISYSLLYAEETGFFYLFSGKKKTKEILEHEKEEEGLVGKFSISGNAVSFQRNGKLKNKGSIHGEVASEGKETKGSSKLGQVIAEWSRKWSHKHCLCSFQQ